MRILMLTPYVPYPPASGGQIRTLNLLKHLSAHNDITLISLYKNDLEKRNMKYLRPFCKEIYLCKRPEKPWQLKTILRSVLSADPFLIARNFSQEAKQTVNSLLKNKQFDVIHAETFYIMPHIDTTSIPVFLVEQTIEYRVYQHFVNNLPFFLRPLFMLDILKLKFWEQYYWKKAVLVGTVSESDNREIRTLEPSIRPVVVPNCAGDEMFVEKASRKDPSKPVILFIGNFYWLQNTEAAQFIIRSIAPLLAKSVPHAQIVIAGQNAQVKLKDSKAKNVSLIDLSPTDTETVKKLYRSATLFIAPIFGPGGTRLKILAAMASRLPVVSTKTGVEGLQVVNNEHVLIASSAPDFAAQIELILSDQALYQKLEKASFDLVSRQYSWKSIAAQLEVIYSKIRREGSR